MDLVYSDELKTFLRLEAPAASGNRATLMSVLGDDTNLVKVINSGHMPPHAAFIWETIRAACGGLSGVSQMRGLVRKRPAGEVIGYLVENVKGAVLDEVKFTDVWEAVGAAAAAAATFAEMDEREVYQGDAHYCNQMVTGEPGRRLLKLVDVDSFSFAAVTWPDGTEAAWHCQDSGLGFGPPEYFTGAPLVHSAKTSGYVCAEVVYRILMGFHPAEVKSTSGDVVPLAETIKRKLYGRFEPEQLRAKTRVAIDEGVVPWSDLPRDLRWLFTMTFTKGRRNEDARPRCRDYAESLSAWAKSRPAKKRTWGPAVATSAGAAVVVAAALVTGVIAAEAVRRPKPDDPKAERAEPVAVQPQQPAQPGGLWNPKRK